MCVADLGAVDLGVVGLGVAAASDVGSQRETSIDLAEMS